MEIVVIHSEHPLKTSFDFLKKKIGGSFYHLQTHQIEVSITALGLLTIME